MHFVPTLSWEAWGVCFSSSMEEDTEAHGDGHSGSSTPGLASDLEKHPPPSILQSIDLALRAVRTSEQDRFWETEM